MSWIESWSISPHIRNPITKSYFTHLFYQIFLSEGSLYKKHLEYCLNILSQEMQMPSPTITRLKQMSALKLCNWPGKWERLITSKNISFCEINSICAPFLTYRHPFFIKGFRQLYKGKWAHILVFLSFFTDNSHPFNSFTVWLILYVILLYTQPGPFLGP